MHRQQRQPASRRGKRGEFPLSQHQHPFQHHWYSDRISPSSRGWPLLGGMPSSSTSSDSSRSRNPSPGTKLRTAAREGISAGPDFFLFCSSVTGRERGGHGWRQQETNKNLIIVGFANVSRLAFSPFSSLVILSPIPQSGVIFTRPLENTPCCFFKSTFTDSSSSRIQHRGWLSVGG